MKKRFTFLIAAIMLLTMIVPTGEVWGQATPTTLYSETFGDNGSSNTAYASYSGYSATTDMFVGTGAVSSHYTGSGKVGKNNVNVSDYDGASGKSAAWYTAATGNNTTEVLVISDIDISGYASLTLSFGMIKISGTGNNKTNNTTVTYKIDNGNYQTFSFTNPTDNNWHLESGSLSGTGSSLTIKFTMSTNGGYTTRYDDIKVTGVSTTPTPTTYTITYKSGEGGGADVTDTKNAGVDYTVLDKPNTFTAPENKPTFNGWLGSDEVVYAMGDTYDTDEDLTLTAQWVDDPNAPVYAWEKTDISGLYPDDVFVIVGNNGSNYAMKNYSASNSGPVVSSVSVNNGRLNGTIADDIKWNISGNAVDGFIFYPNGSTTTWLYCNASNNGLRVGNTNNGKQFTYVDGGTISEVKQASYLYNVYQNRYVGIYSENSVAKDWRSYTTINNNIKDQTFSFYKYVVTNNIFETAGDWDDEANWSLGVVPTTDYAVTINAACEIPAGCVATANSITLGNSGSITIAETGQLVCSNSVAVTMQKAVTEYSDASKTDWYTLSTPVHTGNYNYVTFDNIEHITDNDYNVYYLDEEQSMWMNNQNNLTGYNILNTGRGYIYRNSEAITLEFSGNSNVNSIDNPLSYTPANTIAGFNLIGNPFTHNIYKGANAAAIPNGALLEEDAYALDTDGTWSLLEDGTAIAPMQSLLVQAKEQGGDDPDYTLTMYNTTGGASGSKYADDNIWFTVKNAQYTDEACVKFKEGHGLNKIEHRNDQAPMLYIINEGEKFGVADMPDNTKVINLGFEAKTMGQYTISIKAEGHYSYMHLIDKFSGNDVDMLVEDSYTFVGAPNDRNDRFVLRLNYNAAGIDNESDTFAYQSGNDIIVSGEGDLQVFDVTGRMVKNAAVNGVETIAMPKGVYIFRLNEKVQKIVVR